MAVLVTAASQHGATREIAGEISAELTRHGWETVVRHLDEVPDLVDFEAVTRCSTPRSASSRPPARCRGW